MSVSYNYDQNNHQLPHQDSSSSYDQGYNSQPQQYSHSVTSDGFSDISFSPYSSKPNSRQYYGYSNNVFSPEEGRRQVLDVKRFPINDGRLRARDSSADSSIYNHRAPSIISSVGRDADVESISSHQTHTTTMSYGTESVSSNYDQFRYNGELYRPVAAPRKVNSHVKKLFGEIHPRMLRPEEKPIVESGEETEDSMSFDSHILPRPAPRASMRMSRSKTVVEFLEEDAMRLENSRLAGILKSASVPSRLDTRGSKFVVRFEYVDKYADNKSRRDMTDYSDVDSDQGGGKSKKNKNKQKDIWSHVAPVGPKPARNARSNSLRSNSSSKRRSSSADRARGSQRSGSRRRSSSASGTSRKAQSSPSLSSQWSQKDSTPGHSNGDKQTNIADVDVDNDGQVAIKMPENGDSKKTNRHNSMIGDIRKGGGGKSMCSDPQKVCKWALIIGVPSFLLIIVIIVVVVIFSSQ